MDSRDLNHGHAICAEDLRLASLCPVNGRIHGHIMRDMGGSAFGCGDKIGHVITLAVGARGGLVDSVKIHCKTFLSIDGWCVM